MKATLLKMGMPVMAFMVAIAFAFATETQASDKEALVVGYILNSSGTDCVTAPRDCNTIVGSLCKTLTGSQVYAMKNGTSCVVELFHRDTP